MAQTPGAGTGTTFWDRVAQKLGIDTPKLQEAVKSARTDQIDEAVQNGDLTQKQADALKQRLDQMPDDGPGRFGGPRQRGLPPFGGPAWIGLGDAVNHRGLPGHLRGSAQDRASGGHRNARERR
jgi:hypothetical protein